MGKRLLVEQCRGHRPGNLPVHHRGPRGGQAVGPGLRRGRRGHRGPSPSPGPREDRHPPGEHRPRPPWTSRPPTWSSTWASRGEIVQAGSGPSSAALYKQSCAPTTASLAEINPLFVTKDREPSSPATASSSSTTTPSRRQPKRFQLTRELLRLRRGVRGRRRRASPISSSTANIGHAVRRGRADHHGLRPDQRRRRGKAANFLEFGGRQLQAGRQGSWSCA